MDYHKSKLLHLIAEKVNKKEFSFAEYTFDSSEKFIKCSDSKKVVLFSENVMYEIMHAQMNVLGTFKERGFFIYGKEIAPNVVLFFKTTDNEFLNAVVCRKNLSNSEVYRKSTVLMGEDSLFEMLDNTVDRELPNKEKAIDSIVHFHVHNDLDINTSKFSIKDLYLYSDVLPSINKELSDIGESHKINFYGALMCPDVKKKRITFNVIESNKSSLKETAKFKICKIPIYQLSNEADMIELVSGNKFFQYAVGYDKEEDKIFYHLTDYIYSDDVTETLKGQRIIDNVKQYVKKTKW